MSSMIAIFLMPISVADSVHILSEFFDTYHKFRNKAETIKHVVGHLFMPMLYTTLTTIAGFASLGTTPIPPVRVFGLHVAFGVGLAWLLTMTFVPAYIMIFVRTKMLDNLKSAKAARFVGDPHLPEGFVRRALEHNPPPLHHHRRPKVYYATQVSSEPPTIVLICNNPAAFSPQYRRYLLGVFRDQLSFGRPVMRSQPDLRAFHIFQGQYRQRFSSFETLSGPGQASR